MAISEWKVITVSGVAGGITPDAVVNLRIECKADTVEEVRNLVQHAPDLVWYLRELTEAVQTLSKRHGTKTPECLPYAIQALENATEKQS